MEKSYSRQALPLPQVQLQCKHAMGNGIHFEDFMDGNDKARSQEMRLQHFWNLTAGLACAFM
eukprot:5630063-Amphidinium_carterae.1